MPEQWAWKKVGVTFTQSNPHSVKLQGILYHIGPSLYKTFFHLLRGTEKYLYLYIWLSPILEAMNYSWGLDFTKG